MAELVSAEYVEVDGVRLSTTVVKFDAKRTDTREMVKTINRERRAQFFTEGIPEFELSLEVRILRGEQNEIDWDDLSATGKLFTTTVERDDGSRKSYVRCKVIDLAEGTDADGNATRTVTIKACDVKPE